ncbi:hypothetical protein LguiB_027796 [Lonicera macranthoides]
MNTSVAFFSPRSCRFLPFVAQSRRLRDGKKIQPGGFSTRPNPDGVGSGQDLHSSCSTILSALGTSSRASASDRLPSRLCFWELTASFPGGHPSWDCSGPSTLNFGVLMGSEANEPPKRPRPGIRVCSTVNLQPKGLAPQGRIDIVPYGRLHSAPTEQPFPSGFCSWELTTSFPGGHPSWDCSGPLLA